ncbi:MAG: DUF2865 domain-containing protein [Hyphomicrobiales bacterium]|nr:DUF2865 domain-containing protein [Hyphomicrobiales bacterium]
MATKRHGLKTALAAFALIAAAAPALAQSAACSRMASQISAMERGAAGRGAAALRRQQNDLARTIAHARQLGCDRLQIPFFGGSRPPQCDGLNAQIQQMQANVSRLQAATFDDANAARALRARYENECRNPRPARAAAPNFIERLFGVRPEPQIEEELPPLTDDTPRKVERLRENDDGEQSAAIEDQRPSGGSMAVCVRVCDGGFFPVSYSARRGSLEDLQQLCTALCPNTAVRLYTRRQRGDMKSAVSIEGDLYKNLPNAFKYEKVADKSCTCKPPDQSWSQALAHAETMIDSKKGDINVTPEKAEELSRVAPARKPQTSRAKFDPDATAKILREKAAASRAQALPDDQ